MIDGRKFEHQVTRGEYDADGETIPEVSITQ